MASSTSTPLRHPALPDADDPVQSFFDLSPEDQIELERLCDEARADQAAGRLLPAIYLDANGNECVTGLDD